MNILRRRSFVSTSPITLCTDQLSLVLDPTHGAEIVELRHARAGSLLWRAPSVAAPQGGDLDEAEWTSGYSGGWQVLFPNAGEPSPPHGFHGSGSVSPWEVMDARADRAHLRWERHGLRLDRVVVVRGAVIELTDTVVNVGERPAHYLLGHHPAFAVPGVCQIDAPQWSLEDLDTGERGTWPRTGNEDWSRVEPGRPLARFGCLAVTGLARMALRTPAATITFAWDAADFPWCWVWVDLDALADPPWRGRARLVALEPVTAPHHRGLREVARDGAAPGLVPDGSRTHRLQVAVA